MHSLNLKMTTQDPDPETMRAELKQAFRLFDKNGTVGATDCAGRPISKPQKLTPVVTAFSFVQT